MDELMQMPIWVMWRYEEVKGKTTKVPYSAKTLCRTGSNEPYKNQWVTYDQADDLARANRFDGVGFIIPEGLWSSIWMIVRQMTA